MNKKVSLDAEVLRSLYKENKEIIVPIGVIFASILLMILFLIPQVNGYFQKQDAVKSEREKLNNLSDSLSAINGTSDDVLEKNLEIVSYALPPNKDFAAILNAISHASQVSGASLGDFEFQIGDITKAGTSPTGTPSLKVSLNISGDTSSTIAFLRELGETTPISEASSVKSSGNFSTVEVVFYYRPFPPSGTTDPEKIRPISASNQKVIDALSLPANLDLNLSPEFSNPL